MSLVGYTVYQFEDDLARQSDVTRCLEVISEASRHLTTATKDRHPGIRWREIAGAGNIYRHNYERVSAETLWKTVNDALPALCAAAFLELSDLS